MGIALLCACAIGFAAPGTGSSATREPSTLTQTPERFASRDGRCRFARPRVVLAHVSRTAAERIGGTLEIALSELPERPGRSASHVARLAACRVRLADAGRRASTYVDERTLRIGYDRDGVLAVALERFENLTPSAHPNTSYAAYVFDLASGASRTTQELFLAKSDAALRRLIVADLHRQDLAHPTEPDTAPLYATGAPHFGAHDVLIHSDGIDIYNLFDFHAAAGVIAHVSASELRRANIIAPSGPLRIFLH